MPAASAQPSSRIAMSPKLTDADDVMVARRKPTIGANASVNSDVTAVAASDTHSVCAHDRPAPRYLPKTCSDGTQIARPPSSSAATRQKPASPIIAPNGTANAAVAAASTSSSDG